MNKGEGIRIFLRIRPTARGLPRPLYSSNNDAASTAGTSSNYDVDHTFDKSVVHFHVDRRAENDVVNNALEDYRFKFRRVFEPNSNQEEIFNIVAKDCVLSALDGYNSTIFAYGQTGSGKTYSITGGTESYNDRGIIPRTIGLIYDEVARRRDVAWTISISYLQIYNDKGQDLLNHGKDARKLEDLPLVTVHENEDDVILRGLEQHGAPSTQEALNLLFLGDTNRLYCETPMNKTSSRSHCVFTIHIEARVHGSSVVRRSKLHLVDLAGSERVAKTGVSGTILTEAKHINLSLHYLEQVIMALGEQASGRRDHIPFRNSFMTMVLRDSLGPNCRTAMLATAHPALDQLPETISTCRFAQRVALIRQEARVNEEIDPILLVRKLKAELQQVRDQLAFYTKEGDGAPDRELSDDEKRRCEEMVQRFLTDSNGEVRMEGFDGDLARIYYCFDVMRRNFSNTPGSIGNISLNSCKNINSNNLGSQSINYENVDAYRARVDALELSLQQKENEMNMLFDVLQKTQRPRFNAETQTGMTEPNTNLTTTSSPSVPTTRVEEEPLRPSSSQRRAVCERLPPGAATAVDEFFRKQEQLQESYDLSSLTDADLLQDRATAFEAFKRSYRQCAQVEANKRELKSLYESCKETARRLNEEVDHIKSVKTTIQRLRAERVLQGVDEVDETEKAALEDLAAHKTTYNDLAGGLRKQKETIDAMHLFMKRSQEQLTKDFEDWLQIRQKQLALATGGTAVSAPRPPFRLQTQPSQEMQSSQRHSQEQQEVMDGSLMTPTILTGMTPTVPSSVSLFTSSPLQPAPHLLPGAAASSRTELPPLRRDRVGATQWASTIHGNHNNTSNINNNSQSTVVVSTSSWNGHQLTTNPNGNVQRPYPSTAPASVCRSDDKVTTPASGRSLTFPQQLSHAATHTNLSPLRVLRAPLMASTTNTTSNGWVGSSIGTGIPFSGSTNNNLSAGSNGAVDLPNPYAPEHRSTGDAAADKQLAELYKARDAMRLQLES